ncbi:MAG: hypothetical protein AAF081_14195 [Actinomycetota bacterium]
MELRRYDLRYLITSLILDLGGEASTTELRRTLAILGVDLGDDPGRRIHGALRSEVRKGRLVRVARGRYAIDRLPRATRDRIRHHARNLETALRNGETTPTTHRPEGATAEIDAPI